LVEGDFLVVIGKHASHGIEKGDSAKPAFSSYQHVLALSQADGVEKSIVLDGLSEVGQGFARELLPLAAGKNLDIFQRNKVSHYTFSQTFRSFFCSTKM
jgi:hypothetical protein